MVENISHAGISNVTVIVGFLNTILDFFALPGFNFFNSALGSQLNLSITNILEFINRFDLTASAYHYDINYQSKCVGRVFRV